MVIQDHDTEMEHGYQKNMGLVYAQFLYKYNHFGQWCDFLLKQLYLYNL